MNPKVTLGLRILLGIFCLVFGLNKFLGFLSFPPIEGDGGTLMGIYFTSGFLKIIGVLEILAGIAFLAGKYIPLALIITTAIMFNAALFHALHDMGNIAGAILGVILSLLLVYAYRDRFSTVLKA